MVGNVATNKLISIAHRVSALLLPLTLLLPSAVMAIQIGGADDPCASTSDPMACYKTMASGMKTGNSPMTSGSAQLKGVDTGSTPEVSSPPQAVARHENKSQEARQGEQEPQYSEFQTFIATSVGKILPKYGYDLFGDVPDTFAPLDNTPVTPDYLIGPGDEIIIKGWGQVDIDVHTVVNRNGEISIPKVGVIDVAGIRYQDLQSHIKTAIGKVFRHFELNVSLGRLRTIQVFVVGQAKRPGVYTVSSLSTLVNTLFASGGPSLTGSLRHVQVRRNGKQVTEMDMYDFLLNGDKSKDVALLPGDVIYIPPVGKQVAIYGSIKNPAIYELKDDKTTLADLLALAGGMTPTAAGQKVLLERIQDRKVRQVEEFPLDNDGLSRPMKDGDLVKVFPIEPRFDNAVTLRGNVATPGRYPWKEGMRVKDLIPNMDSLIMPGYWLKQNQSDRVRISGEVQLQSDIKRATAEINLDYATVERLNKVDLTSKLLTFNLGKAIEGKDDQNLLLQPGDTISIFSKDDIQVPIADRSVYVRLEGEVVNAGVYKTLPGETLRQILARVGGLTQNAYLYGAEFDRESVRVMQQEKLNQMVDKMEEAIQRNLSSKAQNALSPEDVASSKEQATAQEAMVARLRKTQATGRVVLGISPDNKGHIDELPDLVLEDGDRFAVPARPSVVSVMGMVYNDNTFLYHKNMNVGNYLDQAGGPTRDADSARMYLLHADGSVMSAQSSSSFFGGSFTGNSVQPGDAVIVPEMLDKTTLTKDLKDWTQILYQFALGVAGVKILRQ